MRRRFSRFPLRAHPALDNSSTLDAEHLDPRYVSFESDLRSDMTDKSLAELHRLYPELTFSRAPVKQREKGHAFTERRDGWETYADWRMA